MIKRVLVFSNPAYLSLSLNQLVAVFPEPKDGDEKRSFPVEDIGIVVLDNPRITVTQAAISALLEANTAILSSSANHLPNGLMLPLCGNTLQSRIFWRQTELSVPAKKKAWKQTVEAKIKNQIRLLECERQDAAPLKLLLKNVKSNDAENCEGQAAAWYWKNIFGKSRNFVRSRDGEFPNALLNYGYAVLRAVVARALVCAGLHPTLGIFHRNKYNAYCLADDLMEPYRPFVDKAVLEILAKEPQIDSLTKQAKGRLYAVCFDDALIGGNTRPLMLAAMQTAASFSKIVLGEKAEIDYPSMPAYGKTQRV